VPEAGSTHELNLANERVQVLTRLADLGAEAARTRLAFTPEVFAQVIAQTPAVRIEGSAGTTSLPSAAGTVQPEFHHCQPYPCRAG